VSSAYKYPPLFDTKLYLLHC